MSENAIPAQWVKNASNGEYFDLLRLDLNTPYFNSKDGIYIIWYASPNKSKVIRVGHGHIVERLKAHLRDPLIREFANYGPLKVTWTLLTDSDLSGGGEAFLYDYYKPLTGERPDKSPIPIKPLI